MIVDAHTHLWQSPEQLGPQLSALLRERLSQPLDAFDAGPRAHEQAMRSVDMAVVMGYRSRYLDAEVPNSLISSYVATAPDRLIGLAAIDPMIDGYLDEVDQAVGERLSGITISPAGQNFHPLHTRVLRLYEKCQRLDLPLAIQQGTHFTRDFKLEYARPFLFDEVARDFPDLRIVIGHVGYPWWEETLILVGKHKCVYADLSNVVSRPWQLYNVLLQAHLLEVSDRLLFGSDFPYHSPERAIETMYSLNRFTQGTSLPGVPREKIRGIVERDVLACFGIKRGSGPASRQSPAEKPGRAPATENRS